MNYVGDFCYIICQTVEFYLYKKMPLVQYVYQEGVATKLSVTLLYLNLFMVMEQHHNLEPYLNNNCFLYIQ